MKNIAKVSAVVLALILIISLAACGGSGNSASNGKASAVTGTWENSEYGIVCTFNENGTGTINQPDFTANFTYTDKGNSVEVIYDGTSDVQNLDYTMEGETLVIAGIPYTKK